MKNTLQEALNQRIGNLYEPESYFERTSDKFRELGFHRGNTIAGALTCRDELCFSLVKLMDRYWGSPFILSGLAGMLCSGKTALRAMISHAPSNEAIERYCFFVFSHIGYSEDLQEGACYRPGRKEVSSACGALLSILSELRNGALRLIPDPGDWELSYLKMRLLQEIPFGHVPGLWELTELAVTIAVRDLESYLAEIVDPGKANYVIASGIHIHTPEKDFIFPREHFAIIEGNRFTVKI